MQILGGDMQIHGTNNILRHPRDNADIRADLFFDSSLFHSTVMMRKERLTSTRSLYDINLPLSQDYGLWAALMFFPQSVFANLAEPLSVYRLSEKPRPGYAEKQFHYANEVRGRILKRIGLPATRHNLACHLAFLYCNAEALGVTRPDCEVWGEKLLEANSKTPLTDSDALERQVAARLTRIFARGSG